LPPILQTPTRWPRWRNQLAIAEAMTVLPTPAVGGGDEEAGDFEWLQHSKVVLDFLFFWQDFLPREETLRTLRGASVMEFIA